MFIKETKMQYMGKKSSKNSKTMETKWPHSVMDGRQPSNAIFSESRPTQLQQLHYAVILTVIKTGE